MIIPAEITAAISVLKYWPQTDVVPLAAFITIFLVIFALANMFHVRVYGYIEYYMSFVKCAAIVLMIFFMFIMTSGGIPATNGPIEFRYWKNPGAFNNGIKGISKAFVQAAFSFGGGMMSEHTSEENILTGYRRAYRCYSWRSSQSPSHNQENSSARFLENVYLLRG